MHSHAPIPRSDVPPARLRAVVFDWAGTTIDHGCCAPPAVFRAAFESLGVPISEAEARAPMGRPKKDHIRAIGEGPEVAARWLRERSAAFSEADVEAIYAHFLPLQIARVTDHSVLIEGTLATTQALRERGLKIGSTTGYTRAIMDVCAPLAATQGYAPDVIVCSDDVPSGRPAPHMLLSAMIALDVYPPSAVVKVGDTLADVREGVNAGAWVVGVSLSGNEVGLTAPELAALSDADREAHHRRVSAALKAAGAHLVIPDISALMPALVAIEGWLATGRRP